MKVVIRRSVVNCPDLPHDPVESDSLGPDELAGRGSLEFLRPNPMRPPTTDGPASIRINLGFWSE